VDRKTMQQPIMNQGTRSIFRWIHIIFAIPILGYIYSPFEKLPDYAPATRFVFLPVMVLTGLWMWKGHVLRRLISRLIWKGSAQQDAADNP
jgi:thiosulfate reductase cytochrome b subunit